MIRQYVAEILIDLGERIHIRSIVKPKCEQALPFEIKGAKYELYAPDDSLEDTGDCTINGHELDALIQPKKAGTYTFKYVYEVADEIWIDAVKLKVS